MISSGTSDQVLEPYRRRPDRRFGVVYRFADRVRERAHIEVFGVLAKFRDKEVAAMRSLHPELLGPRPVSVHRAHGDVFTCDGKMR